MNKRDPDMDDNANPAPESFLLFVLFMPFLSRPLESP